MILNNSFRQHIFDTVTTTIKSHLSTYKQNTQITKNSEFDWDLDMSNLGISFLINDLERKTLLDLDVQFSQVVTVGDICNLIEQRFQQINRKQLLSKINSLPLKIETFMPFVLKNNQK